MPAVVQTDSLVPPRNDTIARSMSRYRGHRNNRKSQIKSPPVPMIPSGQRQLPESHFSPKPYDDFKLPLETPSYRPNQGENPRRIESNRRHLAGEDVERDMVTRQTAAASPTTGNQMLPAQQNHIQIKDRSSARITHSGPRKLPEAVQLNTPHAIGSDDRPKTQFRNQEKADPGIIRGVMSEDLNDKGLEKTNQSRVKRQSLRQSSPPINRQVAVSDRMGFVGQEYKQKQTDAQRKLLPRKSFTQRVAGTISKVAGSDSRADLKRTISFPIPIEPGSVVAGTTPGFDAPISAVNAGERKVMVKCQDHVVPVIITPSTTPIDVIHFTSSKMPGLVDPNSVVLLEAFKQVGLERPLRRYEHIRDVLNSWDNDEQNTLSIVPSPTGGNDDDLDMNKVPRGQPGETTVYLYHSQTPGKWDKRWITLRSDGQVLIAKNLGGETTNICHLSDFDIYVPTARQMSKKIKPPKKVCFAVKSQQKSSMFMSTANFVHFFCSSDKKLATSWYKAVQEWRSWYLVNVMGEGQDHITNAGNAPPASGLHRRVSMKAPSAVDRIQQNINPHQDVLLSRAPMAGLAGPAQSEQVRVRPVRDRGAPPVSLSKKLTKDAITGEATTRKHGPALIQKQPEQVRHAEPFEPTSLLGRTYSQRQKAMQSQPTHNPRTAHSQAPVIPAATNSLNRSSSQRHKPRPLVDLTPTYAEPPQHSRKGRGVIPDQIPPGGLVDIATSPETAIPIPPTTTWQRPRESSPATQRTQTLRGSRPAHLNSPHTSPERRSNNEDAAALTGGPLAKTSKSQGGTGMGRGVMSGDRQARGPMMDMKEPEHFAQGSLLAGVTGVKEGDGGVGVVDRERRRSVKVGVGEGV